jgi:Flp pilus assembly protein TadG
MQKVWDPHGGTSIADGRPKSWCRCAGREDGQALVMMLLSLIVLLGFAGLVVDLGRVYVAKRQLQQAVDASALAAAQDLPSQSTASTTAVSYSAVTGNKNAHVGLAAASPVVTFKCLSSTGIPCQSGTGNCNCNAIQVSESANVPSTFLSLFGANRFAAVTSTSTVSMHGGTPHPLDIAVVLDTTASMNSSCGNDVVGITSGNSTKLDCAKEGIRALLTSLYPCSPTLTSCGSPLNGNVSAPLDEIGLFTFPGIKSPTSYTHDTTSTRSNLSLELGCPGGLHATPTWYTPLGSSQNEVDVVTRSGSSNFTLTFGGSTTSPSLSSSASASAVQTALQNLTSIGSGNVTVSGNSGGPYTVTFVGSLSYQNVGALTGSFNVSVSNTPGVSIFPQWYLDGNDIGYSGSSLTYQVVGLSSDYRSNDTTQSLTSTSKIVQASSWSSCSGATWPGNEYYGVNSPGGAGTYIAGAITAAQNAISADSARHAVPVIIVLSDGDANTKPTGSTSPCWEAIQAADAAAAAGTDVYSIAYDSDNTSNSCTLDPSPHSNLTGFTTMQQIASDSQKFYCLNPPSGQTCNSASATSLKQIFTDIGVDVTNTRILPDNTN